MTLSATERKHSRSGIWMIRIVVRFRGLILAAGVAYRQLGPALETVERPTPPYVLLLPVTMGGLSRREVTGATILTESLDLSGPDSIRLIDSSN